MVDPSVCPTRASIELADVVRRFGPAYAAQYGEHMLPSQRRALARMFHPGLRNGEISGRLCDCPQLAGRSGFGRTPTP